MTTEFSPKKCAINISAVFVFIYVFDMLVHGQLLKNLYAETAHLWRPMEEMQAFAPLCFFFHFAVAAVVSALFSLCGGLANCETSAKPAKGKSKAKDKDLKECSVANGTMFGLVVGLLMGVLAAGAYIYLPIPPVLAIWWFLTNLIKGMGIGIILGFINKKFA